MIRKRIRGDRRATRSAPVGATSVTRVDAAKCHVGSARGDGGVVRPTIVVHRDAYTRAILGYRVDT